MKSYVPLRTAVARLGLHPNTLRRYADEGKIETIRNAGRQRQFNIESYTREQPTSGVLCYCRVSSTKQKDDLARQVVYMQQQFPEAEIIQDVGSGINFKRKGLQAVLERVLRGDRLTVICAHKDRLARFGFELIEFLVRARGGEIVVLDRTDVSPESELTKDLLQILHVFSCRMHGLRRYRDQIKEDKTLS